MIQSFISLLIQTADAASEVVNTGAEVASDAPVSGWAQYQGLIMIVLLIAIFYFLLIRPQQKKQKEIRKMREGLKKGDKVVTAGGIYGYIYSVEANTLIISIADGVKIEVDKGSVYASPEDAQMSQAK